MTKEKGQSQTTFSLLVTRSVLALLVFSSCVRGSTHGDRRARRLSVAQRDSIDK